MGKFPFIVDGRSVSFVTDRIGFGNRLIPIGCVLSLATELNYSPRIFWTPDKVVGEATFGDLFDTTDLPFELIEGREARTMGAIIFGRSARISRPKRIGLGLLRSMMLLQYDKRIELPDRKSHVEFRDKVATDLLSFHKIVLSSFGFIRYGYDLSWLNPAPQVAQRVTELRRQFAPNTVGIHFRGTDFVSLGKTTPAVDEIIARMRIEIELDSNVKFFFASDGDKQGEVIADLFKDRLIKFKKGAGRGSIQGQQDAVVDLFGLAGTSRIIGSKYSSFPLLASLIGNAPFFRIKFRS